MPKRIDAASKTRIGIIWWEGRTFRIGEQNAMVLVSRLNMKRRL